MKEKTHFTKAQIEEIAEVILSEIGTELAVMSPDDVKNVLTEKFGKPKEPEEWPRQGDKVFFIDGFGQVKGWEWCENNTDDMSLKEIGNLYRTKEAAEAKVELTKHIQSFCFPKIGKVCWYLMLEWKQGFTWLEGKLDCDNWQSESHFFTGYLLPVCTEADRTERIRLLKLCYS